VTDSTPQRCRRVRTVRAWPTALLLCLLAVACATTGAQADTPWWNGRWRYRTLFTVGPGGSAAHLWLHVRQGADNGGRDLRVIGPDGKEVAFGIMHTTPEGRYLLGIRAQRQGTYAVYYGNPDARPAQQAAPRAGLIYTTLPMPEDPDASSWAAANITIKKAGAPYGADYWDRVFDAYNPWGPQEDYIAVYDGYIRISKAGKHEFATMSDNSSFVLVDGKPVAEWPGAHNIWSSRRGQHSGAVQLETGLHSFKYVHFAFGGPARGAVAWKTPGSDRFDIMPRSAFVPIVAARPYECQQYGQAACADFTYTPQSYCEAGDAKMTAYRFVSVSGVAPGELIERYEWSFGDGQASTDSQPSHAYTAPGVYPVTLAIISTTGRRASCTKLLRVGPIWNDLRFTLKKRRQFVNSVRRYQLHALPTPALLGAWELFKDMEEEGKAVEAARHLYERRDGLQPEQTYAVAMALAAHYRANDANPKLARQYLDVALSSVPESDHERRFAARFALCDHYYYDLGETDKARQEYRRLRADFPHASPDRRREALIRIGDTYRDEGNAEEALKTYREAEEDAAYVPDKPATLVVGALIHEVQSYLRRGESKEGLKRLEELLWYYPTMRLEGQPALLRVQACLIGADFKEARRQANVYIRIGKDANFLPAVHVAAADACTELGLIDEAIKHYRTVIDDFPEAAEVQEAENGLRRLEG